ncbi:hypothetical protein [Vibrio phage vB_VpaP_G1]|uniref:Uncharacterized protein n=1 Tax=Vibrio phage vB_VpaP_G1 TaxID=2862773 RepID=A0AAE7WUW5_9CAUD|nr:hypothetical protein PP280_gp09 [Vibrio phage vB_VpaP_G1]QYW05809.1 hypothetical protein [Vibrio phage vB_VpaP_G1]
MRNTNKRRVVSEEYRKAMKARKDRRDAKARAQVEQESLSFTSEGDFTHLARNTMKFNRR